MLESCLVSQNKRMLEKQSRKHLANADGAGASSGFDMLIQV